MLTVNGTNWNEVRHVTTVTSTNVVLKFEGAGNDVLWVKGAPGLERVEFAHEMLDRSGFPVASRMIPWNSQEYAEVVGKVRALGDGASIDQLGRLQTGRWNLMVSPNAGQTYQQYTDGFASSAEKTAEYIRLLGTNSIQQDIARIIAADLLLGNFDRFGFKDKGGGTFHMGNFVVDLSAGARFIPIDNDTVSPSLAHVSTANNKPATPEMLYAVVIEGGSFEDPNKAFSSVEQSSMSGFLGANAAEVVYQVLNAGMQEGVPRVGEDRYANERQQLRQYAAVIAPMIRQYISDLLRELKNPGGQREGLNSLMKAQQHLEGMNYDTFKLKSRFAALMVDAQNLDPAEVERRAHAYQKYRLWKLLLVRLMAPVTEYRRPAAIYNRASNFDLVVRGATKLVTDTTPIDAAHKLKNDIRKNLLDEQQLRQRWDQIKDQPTVDQSIVKAKVLAIAKLYYYDLTSRAEILNEAKSVNAAWVDQFYIKAIRKRTVDLNGIVVEYKRILTDFKQSIEEIKEPTEWNTLATAFKAFEAAVLRA